MRREEWVTVRGPVKKQQPDGMSHGGAGRGGWTPPQPPPPKDRPPPPLKKSPARWSHPLSRGATRAQCCFFQIHNARATAPTLHVLPQHHCRSLRRACCSRWRAPPPVMQCTWRTHSAGVARAGLGRPERPLPPTPSGGGFDALNSGIRRLSSCRQGCIRREGTAEAAPAAVRQAVGGGCQSGWGRLLSVTNAIEAGI